MILVALLILILAIAAYLANVMPPNQCDEWSFIIVTFCLLAIVVLSFGQLAFLANHVKG